MSLESRIGNALSLACATGLTVNAGLAYINRPETARALRALSAPIPNCLEIVPSPRHYKFIAVPGAGTYDDENGITRPNNYQVLRLKAAAAAVVAGYSDKILLIDGGGGSAQQISIELLEKYIDEISFGQQALDRNKVKLISNSLNSAENVKDLKSYMEANGLTNVLSITDLFHYNRLKLLDENYDVNTDIAPTECLAIQYLPGDVPVLVERSYSPEMLNMILKEKFAILELSLDPTGELTIAKKNFFQPTK